MIATSPPVARPQVRPRTQVASEPVLALVTRLGLAALFATTGVTKLAAGEAFVRSLAAYELLPTTLVDVAAATLVLVECGLAALLVTRRFGRRATFAAAALLAAFAAAIASATVRGLAVDCGCLPGVELQAGWWAVARNLAVALGAIIAATRPTRARRSLYFPRDVS